MMADGLALSVTSWQLRKCEDVHHVSLATTSRMNRILNQAIDSARTMGAYSSLYKAVSL